MKQDKMSAILNLYPDSIGKSLADAVKLLKKPELRDVFSGLYLLPSVFNSDLDRGFSVIDYELNETLATQDDLVALKEIGLSLKLDIVLNHASVLSRQFRDLLAKGDASAYKDFFIDWNKFWDGCGTMTPDGFIQPNPEYTRDMFFRKPGLPFLMVTFPDGTQKPYWNTFYQEVRYDRIDALDLLYHLETIQYHKALALAEIVNREIAQGKTPTQIEFGDYEPYRTETVRLLNARAKYLGQMDLNIQSPLVWEFYEQTLEKLQGYGATIIRLDAFAYAPKEPGARNFLNEPGTEEFLARIRDMAEKHSLKLLPEIHAEYCEGIHEKLAHEGYMTYDFFLPGLVLHAMETKNAGYLKRWIAEILEKGIQTVNMLGCHDGIPLLDLRGLLPEREIDSLINIIVGRGGHTKNLHGNTKLYYQVNATYFSALGEDEEKMVMARAVQVFMPGRPQVWYLDLFGGKNDYSAVERAGAGGHKEINRTNLSMSRIEAILASSLVQRQIALLRLRSQNSAFSENAKITVLNTPQNILGIEWDTQGNTAVLYADFSNCTFRVE